MTETVKHIKDVTFELNGVERKIDDLSLQAPNMLHDSVDHDKCEYIVKVE